MSDTSKFRRIDDRITIADPFSTDESDELFSDDEQKKITYRSHASQDTLALHRSETPLSIPLSIDSSNIVIQSNPAIPSTPLSLMPFLNKINEQWTSDLETPQADKSVQLYIKPSTSAIKNTEKTPKPEQLTPDMSSNTANLSIDHLSTDKLTSDSPVIASRRARKCPKRRRIFKTLTSADTSAVTNNDSTANVQIEVFASENINLVSQDDTANTEIACKNHGFQFLHKIQDTWNNEELDKSRNATPDISDSSIQEFFSDASFSNIDKLHSNNCEQATIKTIIKCNHQQSIKNISEKKSVSHIFNPNRSKEEVSLFTASGTTINISKEALSKARVLFAQEIDELSQPNIEGSNVHNEEVKERETKVRNIGFQTGRGAPINISKQALSKAATLFAKELNKPLETSVSEEVNVYNKEVRSPHIAFQTGRDVSINTSEQALSKVTTLFAKELHKQLKSNVLEKVNIQNKEIRTQHTGFQTSNAPIGISEQASSKAKMSITEELNKALEPNIIEKTNIYNKENKKQEIHIGFQTGRGARINISEQALSKAKVLFAEVLDKPLESSVAEEANIYNREANRQEARISNIGFQTDRGTCINSSEQASFIAASFFEEELNESLENNVSEESNVYSREIRTPHIGFQTGRGAPINISKQALSKAATLFAKELDKPLETNVSEEANVYNKEVRSPHIAFQTGCDAFIDTSEQALSKATTLFAKELTIKDKSLKSNVLKKVNIRSKEIRIQRTGFQTSNDAAVNISEQASSKAEMLNTEELDKALGPNVIEKTNIYNKESSKQEIEIPHIGFQTGRGACINISEQALSKAKVLFAEVLDKPLESSAAEEANIYNGEANGQEARISNIGFQTDRGTRINSSEQASSAAAMLFGEKFNESLETKVSGEANVCNREIRTPHVGFQTGRGAPINISKRALSKAATLFAKELDKPLETSVSEEVNVYNKEVRSSHIGLQIDREERPIVISERTLSQAQVLFTEESSESLESNVAKQASVHSRAIRIPNVGFKTARGASISISAEALSKARSFAEQLDCPLQICIPTNIDVVKEKVMRHDVEIPYDRFQRDQRATSSDNASLKARMLYSNDCPDKSKPDTAHVASCASLQKRKLNLGESGTSIAGVSMLELKKARMDFASDESQAGKESLFDERSVANVDDKFKLEDNDVISEMPIDDDTNDRCDGRIEASCIPELSKEIAASTVEKSGRDEKELADSVANSILGSPKRDVLESIESSAIGSPIIGRRSALRKRKSFGHRRDEHDVLEADRVTPNDADVTTPLKNIAREAVACTNKEEPNVESQRSTQAERYKAESNNTESSEYGDTQMMIDFIDASTKILQDRLAAVLEQEKTITARRRRRSEQLTGSLYRYKQIKSDARLSLRDASNGAPPEPRSHQELIDQRIPPNILAITAATAASYKFRCSDFYGDDVARSNVQGIEMVDGGRLIMDENGYVGVWEFLRAFLASPGVDPNLIPARWIENHYRWIVWKLASVDRMKFGTVELPRALTPSCIMAQLKYRYDREIDRSQRPAIRRILEKDDVASKRMVLCVSSIIEEGKRRRKPGDNTEDFRKNKRRRERRKTTENKGI